ncbi:MAG: hypothetical protein PHP50_07310 [Lachnospiraceae bacterium]|nr:hypothetical protein [Lachnospiraceae bacterium]
MIIYYSKTNDFDMELVKRISSDFEIKTVTQFDEIQYEIKDCNKELDCIIADIQEEKDNGINLLHEIKNTTETKNVPVVCVCVPDNMKQHINATAADAEIVYLPCNDQNEPVCKRRILRACYWPMTIFGYILDIIAVPALALVGKHGWLFACLLLVIQRMGKAIKKPAKDTIMSFAATQEGVGKSFGIQEVMDQIGAFAGPVLLYLVMLFKTDGSTFQIYSTCFAVLAIPGAITIFLLLLTRAKFPNPEQFEPEPKEYIPFKMKKEFILYIAGISLFAFGFIDYSIIIMHVSKTYTTLASGLTETSSLVNSGTLPLLYAGDDCRIRCRAACCNSAVYQFC